MAAVVAAALASVGDRLPWLAAILADRYRAPLRIVAAGLVAIAAASAIAAGAGRLLAPLLTPEARQALLALALLLQGGGALWPVRAPDRLDGWRIGAALASLLGLFVLAFGDGVQFVVAALAARSPLPWMAAIGATLGMAPALTTAALLGERGWCALPLVPARRAIAALFVLAGLVVGAGALRLI